MGRTMPTVCKHDRMVDGGDFALSEHCPECDASQESESLAEVERLDRVERQKSVGNRLMAKYSEALAELAELEATNAVLVEWLEDIAELEGNPRVGFFVARGIARKAIEDQGGEG